MWFTTSNNLLEPLPITINSRALKYTAQVKYLRINFQNTYIGIVMETELRQIFAKAYNGIIRFPENLLAKKYVSQNYTQCIINI